MKYLKLLLPVFILVIGFQFLKDYFIGANDNLTEAQELIDNGKTVQAKLNPEYEVMTIGGAETNSFTIKYSFDVNGKTYEEKESVNVLPELTNADNLVDITYLPSNPSVCSINPQNSLTEAQKDVGDKTPLYIGLAAMVIGALTLFGRVKEFKQSA